MTFKHFQGMSMQPKQGIEWKFVRLADKSESTPTIETVEFTCCDKFAFNSEKKFNMYLDFENLRFGTKVM